MLNKYANKHFHILYCKQNIDQINKKKNRYKNWLKNIAMQAEHKYQMYLYFCIEDIQQQQQQKRKLCMNNDK